MARPELYVHLFRLSVRHSCGPADHEDVNCSSDCDVKKPPLLLDLSLLFIWRILKIHRWYRSSDTTGDNDHACREPFGLMKAHYTDDIGLISGDLWLRDHRAQFLEKIRWSRMIHSYRRCCPSDVRTSRSCRRKEGINKGLSSQTGKLLETVVELRKLLNDRPRIEQGDRTSCQTSKSVPRRHASIDAVVPYARPSASP